MSEKLFTKEDLLEAFKDGIEFERKTRVLDNQPSIPSYPTKPYYPQDPYYPRDPYNPWYSSAIHSDVETGDKNAL